MRRFALAHAEYRSCVGADIQAAVARDAQGGDVVHPELGCIADIEDAEGGAVEADKSFDGPEPEIAIGGLRNGLDSVLRQPVPLGPGTVGVMRDLARRIEPARGAFTGGTDRRCGEQTDYQEADRLHLTSDSIVPESWPIGGYATRAILRMHGNVADFRAESTAGTTKRVRNAMKRCFAGQAAVIMCSNTRSRKERLNVSRVPSCRITAYSP